MDDIPEGFSEDDVCDFIKVFAVMMSTHKKGKPRVGMNNSDKDNVTDNEIYTSVENMNFSRNRNNKLNVNSGFKENNNKVVGCSDTDNSQSVINAVSEHANADYSPGDQGVNTVSEHANTDYNTSEHDITISEHADDSQFECFLCEHKYKSHRRLEKHCKKRHRPEEYILQCPLCRFTTIIVKDMKKHKKALHPRDKMTCAGCDFSTKNCKKWVQHIWLENNSKVVDRLDKDYSPSEHGINAVSEHAISDYSPGDHGINTASEFANTDYNTSEHDITVSEHADDSQFECFLCEHKYKSHRRLEKHFKERHRAEEYILQCLLCAFTTITVKEMKKHKKALHPRDKMTCAGCDFSTKNCKKWLQHIRLPHKSHVNLEHCDNPLLHLMNSSKKTINNNGYLKCEMCGRHFQRFSAMKRHMNSHGEVRDFKCWQCSKSFKYRSGLSEHKYLHHNLSKYNCAECNFSTRYLGSFQNHMPLHREAKPHQCTICPKSFTTKSSLTRHGLHHLNVQPYKCNFCDFKTAHKLSIKHHNMKHKGERPFSCQYCDKTFITKAHLNQHLTCIHSDEMNGVTKDAVMFLSCK